MADLLASAARFLEAGTQQATQGVKRGVRHTTYALTLGFTGALLLFGGVGMLAAAAVIVLQAVLPPGGALAVMGLVITGIACLMFVGVRLLLNDEPS
jgi:hypothetical protein